MAHTRQRLAITVANKARIAEYREWVYTRTGVRPNPASAANALLAMGLAAAYAAAAAHDRRAAP